MAAGAVMAFAPAGARAVNPAAEAIAASAIPRVAAGLSISTIFRFP